MSDQEIINQEAISRLQSGEKAVFLKVNGNQRLYTKDNNGSVIAFEIGDNNECLILNAESGERINLNKLEQDFIGENLKDFFIDLFSKTKISELDTIIDEETKNKLKTSQLIISKGLNLYFNLERTIDLISLYLNDLNNKLDNDKKFGINNKALIGTLGLISTLIASNVLKEINNGSNINEVIRNIVSIENVPDTLKSIALSVIRDKEKEKYLDFFNSEEYKKLELNKSILPILVLDRDLNSKEMVARSTKELLKLKQKSSESNFNNMCEVYINASFDLSNTGDRQTMQVGRMLNVLTAFIKTIKTPEEFYQCLGSIMRNMPEFKTNELGQIENSANIVKFMALNSLIKTLDEDIKINNIFIDETQQETLLRFYFETIKNTSIISNDIRFLTNSHDNESGIILTKLYPEKFKELMYENFTRDVELTMAKKAISECKEAADIPSTVYDLVIKKDENGDISLNKSKFKDVIEIVKDNTKVNITDLVKNMFKLVSKNEEINEQDKNKTYDSLYNIYQDYLLKKESVDKVNNLKNRTSKTNLEKISKTFMKYKQKGLQIS